MKVCFLIVLLIGVSSNVFTEPASLSAKTTKESTEQIKNDSSYVHILSYPQQSWFERNEGSLIATLLASLVAIFTVYLTARSNKKQRLERDKEIYRGLLNAIKIELDYHRQLFPIVIEGFQNIRDISIAQEKIIASKGPREIPLNFLFDIRKKLIDSELLNSNILKFISFYINKCEIVNMDMDFENLIRLNEKFKENFKFSDAVKDYFNKEVEEVEKLQKSITGISNIIDNELNNRKTS